MTAWLEVSLAVSGELAEAVADVLARFAPGGVATERGVRFTGPEDESTPIEAVMVRAYLPTDEHIEETRRKVQEALFYLGMIQPLPVPVFNPIADQNWMEAWKEHYQPIPVGKRLIIVPAWMDSPDASRIAIKIDPGMAFGTGTHPTTQLCLELLESLIAPHSSLIDIGCGSGILSIAALKLGVDFALGVDIDQAAVSASRENAQANGIRPEQFGMGVGSVAEILGGNYKIRNTPLVLANILAPVIIHLFDAGLAELVAPGGAIVLSGFLAEQSESVISAMQARGFKLMEERHMGDWVALVGKQVNIQT